MPDDPARKVQPGPGALDDLGRPPLYTDADDWGDPEPISVRRAALAAREAELKAELAAAARKAAEAAEAERFAAWKKACQENWAILVREAAEARAAENRKIAALNAAEGFDPYNLARGLVAGSPGGLVLPGRPDPRGRLGPTVFAALELAFWLAAGGLAELPPPRLLTLDPRLRSLVHAARADRPARALAAIGLFLGGSARRAPEALERHLDSLPGLARAEAEAVPGRLLAFDVTIPEPPASEVFQTLARVMETFSEWRRAAIGLFHIKGLSFDKTAKLLKVATLHLRAELRHGYGRLAGALKAYLTRLAVARGHDLFDFPGLDGLRGVDPTLSPVPSRGELPDRPAPPALEPPEGADTPSAVESESAALARRLAILSPDGLGPDLQPAYELAFWLAAAGLAAPPPGERPPPRRPVDLWGGPLPAPPIRPPIPDPSWIVAPPASEALGVLTRALEGFSGSRRLVFRLCYREGLDIFEVGRRMDLPPMDVWYMRVDGLEMLADKLRDYLLDPARTPGRPAAGQPGVGQPGVDQPGADQPGVDQTGADQPGVDPLGGD